MEIKEKVLSEEIKIRLMQESDLGSLAEVYSEAYRVFDVGEVWTPETARVLLDYWLKRQPDLAFTAECNDQIIGAFVVGIKPWWDGNHLIDGEIFVHPDYQNTGVGTKLSEKMFEEAIDKYNAVTWDTFTFKGHDFPLSWYKRLGFEENKDWVMIGGDIKEALKIIKENK